MRNLCTCIILVAVLATTGRMCAHPVAFDGATQIQATYMGPISSFEAYHTYGVGVAYGLNAELMRLADEDRLRFGLQHNWLLKRLNLNTAQANFYASAGAAYGFGWFQDKRPTTNFASAHVSAQADYETLWIYTAAKSALNVGTNSTDVESTISIGFAPYAHDFDTLATWLIVDFSYFTEVDSHFRVTPKVRLFRNSWFVEAGCSLDGKPLLSCMIHF